MVALMGVHSVKGKVQLDPVHHLTIGPKSGIVDPVNLVMWADERLGAYIREYNAFSDGKAGFAAEESKRGRDRSLIAKLFPRLHHDQPDAFCRLSSETPFMIPALR